MKFVLCDDAKLCSQSMHLYAIFICIVLCGSSLLVLLLANSSFINLHCIFVGVQKNGVTVLVKKNHFTLFSAISNIFSW